jgi:hypothetical protein
MCNYIVPLLLLSIAEQLSMLVSYYIPGIAYPKYVTQIAMLCSVCCKLIIDLLELL